MFWEETSRALMRERDSEGAVLAWSASFHVVDHCWDRRMRESPVLRDLGGLKRCPFFQCNETCSSGLMFVMFLTLPRLIMIMRLC